MLNALEQIGLLYNIERQAKEQQLDQEQILQLRQTEAQPILESLGKWIKETYIKTHLKVRSAKPWAIAFKDGRN